MAFVQPSPGLTDTVATGVEPIKQINTSLPVFLGTSTEGPIFSALFIENWSEFRVHFPNQNSVLSRAVYGYFDNGGQQCYVLNWGENTGLETWRAAFKELDAIDDLTIVVAPGETDERYYDSVLEHCMIRQDRLALLDLPEDWDPELSTALPRSKYAVAYTPWIEIRDREREELVLQPPSGHIAGIYARVEQQRGSHHPPANELIRGAVGIQHGFSRLDRVRLIDAGVNLLRQDRRRGGELRVWGARTLSDDKVWQSLAIRRLLMMLEASIGEGTQWVVHQRNEEPLWIELQKQVTDFLEELRCDRLLIGEGVGDAYYVKCDAELNPIEKIGGEQVIFEVGVSPVKAGDFVIFRICQWPGGIDIAE
jgi:uncharacterized protein